MKIPAFPTLLGLALAGLSGAALFLTSQNVQSSERDLHKLEARIESQREEVRVLKAEWDYLNRPDRLEKLAREKLGLIAQPPEARVADPTKLIEEPTLEPITVEAPLSEANQKPSSGSVVPISLSGGDRE